MQKQHRRDYRSNWLIYAHGLNPVLYIILQALDDSQRLQALQLRAKGRGFDLPDDTGQFLMRRVARDMTALFNLLDKLDEASLSAQRRLTIPFVKTIL